MGTADSFESNTLNGTKLVAVTGRCTFCGKGEPFIRDHVSTACPQFSAVNKIRARLGKRALTWGDDHFGSVVRNDDPIPMDVEAEIKGLKAEIAELRKQVAELVSLNKGKAKAVESPSTPDSGSTSKKAEKKARKAEKKRARETAATSSKPQQQPSTAEASTSRGNSKRERAATIGGGSPQQSRAQGGEGKRAKR